MKLYQFMKKQKYTWIFILEGIVFKEAAVLPDIFVFVVYMAVSMHFSTIHLFHFAISTQYNGLFKLSLWS